jgi:hypothetical protein
MRGSNLTAEQLRRLRECLRPKLSYLTALRNRMEQRNFPESDRLYRAIRLSHEMLKDALYEVETLMSYRGAFSPERDNPFH